MRFREFKIVEGGFVPPAAKEIKYYSVGDSHSNGVSNYSRRPGWKALGKDGSPSSDPMHLQAISTIPKGSNVVISLGANDLAIRPNDSMQTIASRVNNVINTAKAKGLHVVFLLPTLPAPGWPKDPKRSQLRDALKEAVAVPIVDLGQASASDTKMGLHLDPSGYSRIASEVVSVFGDSPSASTSGDNETKPTDRFSTSPELTQGPPFPAEKKNDVKKMQQALQDLGYSVGHLGVDGKYGPATAAAVAAFKKDYGVQGTRSDFGKDSFDMISQINAGQVKRVKPSKPETPEVGDLIADDDPSVQEARVSAEKYLGRSMSDKEWTALLKVTAAEEGDIKAMAWVMAAILNRVDRGSWGSDVVSVVTAPSQFEPVTGPKGNDQRLHLLPIPSGRKLGGIVKGAINELPNVSHNIVNFTSNIAAAYKGRASISYRDKLLARGGEVVGQSVFSA